MLDITFKGTRIEPTLSAVRELIREGKNLYDIVYILEESMIAEHLKELKI